MTTEEKIGNSSLEKIIDYWKDLSNYDLKTAESMLETKRYPYCLFMCHLAIEKLLKAIVVKDTKKHAPYSHHLIGLAKQTPLDFSKKQKELLADLTEFNLEARYPEWQKMFYKKATEKYASQYLNETKKLHQWLKKYLKK